MIDTGFAQLALRSLGLVSLVGLLLGLLVGAFTGGQSSRSGAVSLGDPWVSREFPIDALMETLLTSDHWSRGAIPPQAEIVNEPEPDTAGRPGMFKYLRLVAILREPELRAVLKPEKMPDSEYALMVSSTNEAGLFQVSLNSVVAEGWVVSGISDTYLQIESVESGELVEYRLFEWK